MASRTEAVDDILTLVNAAWVATAVPLGFTALNFEDNRQDRPQVVDGSGDGQPYGRAFIRHFTSVERTLRRGVGQGRYEQFGQVVVQIFSRGGDARRDSDVVSQAIEDALRGKCTTNGVLFREVSGNEVGQTGIWFQSNVQGNFEYDRIS